MAKTIVYPTQEWLDNWMDKYMDEHPDERISDFDALKLEAESAWWDIQVDKGNPTPYDQTAEQKANSKAAMQGMARAVNAYGKQVKRERKPNEAKRELMQVLAAALADYGAELTNPERQVDFTWGGVSYSVTLTAHRAPKAK